MEFIAKRGKNENYVTANDKSSSNLLKVNSLILYIIIFIIF